ncbi:MAG: class I SAM-dependent methyltransferase [Alphaproteobacteria bacterium]|nr:class I SAM-dependent methyltransferase [Alphaproteobacteria bacterium]
MQKYHSHDLNYELQVCARKESAQYVKQHMTSAVMFQGRWPLLAAAIGETARGGLFLEFGVEKGSSSNFIARHLSERGDAATVHAFDSFEGLPDEWSGTFEKRGKFSLKGKLPPVLPNVELHKGWFCDTIPSFLDKNKEGISLLHVDCDIYSSTKDIFGGLKDRIRQGTIIVFDEYFNYHNWQEHEFKAWQEFVQATDIQYSYRGFTARGGQVYVKVL